MLIIFNGVESIKKLAIADLITNQLNGFNAYSIEGFIVDFTQYPIVIKDEAGNIVYGPGNNDIMLNPEDGTLNVEGEAALNRIKAFNDLIIATVRSFYYKSEFTDLEYDYGYSTNLDFLDTYAELMEKYNARPFETVVVTGSFSKAFVEKAKSDLGAENVKMISIVRNPSVSYLFNTISPADVDFRNIDSKFSPIGVKYATEELMEGFLCGIKLKEVEGMTTVKFEDILADGQFDFDGVTYAVPQLWHQAFNEWITVTESTKIDQLYTDELTTFNERMSTYSASADIENRDPSHLPTNVFQSLGYSPLTLSEITSV